MNPRADSETALAENIRARFPRGEPINCHDVACLAPGERRALDAEVFRRLYPERFVEPAAANCGGVTV